jgi:hypothetical protein
MVNNSKFDDLIKSSAKKYSLNWLLVKAVCIKESGLDTWAVRFEPKFKYRVSPEKYAAKNKISVATENVLQSSSVGLMQVMGCVARELDYTDNILKLCIPVNGLEYGCKKLAQLLKRHENLQVTLAAYNAGSGNVKAGEPYSYSVLDIMDRLEKTESQLKS